MATATPWPPGPWPAAWRVCFAGYGPRRRWGKAARRPGEPCGPEARGGGTRACTGAVCGVRRRHSPTTTAAFRRRRRGFCAGKGMGRRRRSRGSSPCSRIGRRWTESRRSTAGGGARREHQWRPVMAARFRTGNGTAELGKSWNRCGARRSGLGCEESSGGGGVWPVRRRRRHCSTRLRPSSRRTKGGENGLGHRDGISTARAAVESNGAATRGHKRRERRRAVPSRREAERGKRRDAGDGSLVIRPKFRMFFCKLNFSLFSWPQMKNF